MAGHQGRGQAAEQTAADFLRARGLVEVGRNYRVRGGEIDLIMRDQEHLVFVEVRYRARNDFGGAAASVTAAKQARLTLAAQHYLQRTGSQAPCRFDVVALDGNQPPQWIRDAFQPG
jgi:putative endonuclease